MPNKASQSWKGKKGFPIIFSFVLARIHICRSYCADWNCVRKCWKREGGKSAIGEWRSKKLSLCFNYFFIHVALRRKILQSSFICLPFRDIIMYNIYLHHDFMNEIFQKHILNLFTSISTPATHIKHKHFEITWECESERVKKKMLDCSSTIILWYMYDNKQLKGTHVEIVISTLSFHILPSRMCSTWGDMRVGECEQ